jgi:hypothetical protein
MKLVPFKSVAGVLRVAAGVAAVCATFVWATLMPGEAWSQQNPPRWSTTLDRLRSSPITDALPIFAKRGKSIQLARGDGYTLHSNGMEIPVALFSAPYCNVLLLNNNDIECNDYPQRTPALVAVLALSKQPDKRWKDLPAGLVLTPQGAPYAGPAPKERKVLTQDNARGRLTVDKFFWIPIDEQNSQLISAIAVYCLDECDPGVPLYTISEAQQGDVGQQAAAAGPAPVIRPATAPAADRVDPVMGRAPGKTEDPAPATARMATAPPAKPPSEVTVTVQNIPPEYNDRMVSRLVLSAVRLRGGTSLTDIAGIKVSSPPAGAAQQKTAVLTVKGSITDAIETVAGERVECQTTCTVTMPLRPRYVDSSKAGKDSQLIAGVRPGGERLDSFYGRLKVNNVDLPKLTNSGLPPGYSIVHLPDDGYFQIYFKAGTRRIEGEVAPGVEAPRWDAHDPRNLLRLFAPAPASPLSWIITAVDDTGLPPLAGDGQPAAGAPGATAGPAPATPPALPPTAAPGPNTGPAPVASSITSTPAPVTPAAPVPPPEPPSFVHYVLRPAADSLPASWDRARMAKRFVELLGKSGAQFMLSEGDVASGPPKAELTPSGDAVVVWSGSKPAGTPAWALTRAAEGLAIMPPGQAAPPPPEYVRTGSRIRANDTVAIGDFRIETPFLYDQWQASIEAVKKVYNQERPDQSNSLCSFSLKFDGNEPVTLKPAGQDKRLLQSDPIAPLQAARLVGARAQLEVQNNDASATCAAHSRDLGVFSPDENWKLSELKHGSASIGRLETRASLAMRGRWLLGLYGPQAIGVGSEAASPKMVADAKDDIVSSQVVFLRKLHEADFPPSQPVNAALGFDFALVSGADAGARVFAEKSVLAGGYRQPKTAELRLDTEGDNRLDAFLTGSSSSGGAVPFEQVGERISRYSQLFGELSGESRPIAVYVGAAPNLRFACQTWREMTDKAARLSGRPRVLGIVFANASPGQLEEQLMGHGAEKALTSRIRGATCEGENGSMLLVVAFPDLVARVSKTVLEPAFEVVRGWVVSN